MTKLEDINWPEDGTTRGRLRFPYRVGWLSIGSFGDLLNTARMLNIDVQDDRAPGWPTRRGMLTLTGKARDLRFFVDCLKDWSDGS